jgi:predicted phosphoribosyltransferase
MATKRVKKRWVMLAPTAKHDRRGDGVISTRKVRQLDFDKDRRERQASLEKQLETSRGVSITSADAALVFASDDGRETGRRAETAVVAKKRVTVADLVHAEPTNPFAPPANFRSEDA